MTVELDDSYGDGRVQTLVIAAIDPIAVDVLSISLRHPADLPLPRWSPGAHIGLQVRPGMERNYSLCGEPDDDFSWRIAVLLEHDSRGGSRYLHTQARVGQRLSVRGPRNRFALVEADEYLFVAGGIGITPILPMVRSLRMGSKEWRLLYGGRGRTSMAFARELEGLGDRVDIFPQDERGLPDLNAFLGTPSKGTAVYCCGPQGLLQAVEQLTPAWCGGALHLERFQHTSSLDGAEEREFMVSLQRTGMTIKVRRGQTVVEAMEEVGLRVTVSCREGTCGTCETDVIDGIPDHRCAFLSPDQRATGETMMICCSRAKSENLILDL